MQQLQEDPRACELDLAIRRPLKGFGGTQFGSHGDIGRIVGD